MNRTPENSWQLRKHLDVATDYSQFENRSLLQNEEHIISNAILSLTVVDPRLPPEKTNNADDEDSVSTIMPGDFLKTEVETIHLKLEYNLVLVFRIRGSEYAPSWGLVGC